MVALAVVLLALVGGARPAAAHAELWSTSPSAGAVLSRSPDAVVLSFSEQVELRSDGIRLYDSRGDRLDLGRPGRAGGDRSSVRVDLPDLDEGAYVVTWRITSVDSHPINGAFTFRVGEDGAGASDDLVRRLVAAEGGSVTVGAVYGVVRFLAFAALVVLIGASGFVLGLWPAGADHGQLRRLVGWAWAAALTTTVAAMAMQAVHSSGRPLPDVLRWSVVSEVLPTRFGRAWGIRALLLAAAPPLLLAAGRAPSARAVRAAWLVWSAALLATPGSAGHPGTDARAAVSVAIDALHLAAVSLWLGGLVALLVVALAGDQLEDRVGAVERFSRWAPVAISTIAVTGSVAAWRQSGSLAALTDTTYGRLVVAKVVLFAAALVVATRARRWVRARLDGGPDAPVRAESLRRTVALEVAFGAVILAVTALLVNTIPGRTALALPESAQIAGDGLVVNLTLDPAKAGRTDLHVYTLSDLGAIEEVDDVAVMLSLPDRDIRSLEVPVRRAGPGHFAAYGFDLPIPGRWRVDVFVTSSDSERQAVTAFLPVR
jgi:copper transport protein